MLRRSLKIALVVLTLTTGAAASYHFWLAPQNETVLRLPGTVEIQEVRLGSKVGGRVLDVAVREGELIEAGDELVTFDVPDLEAKKLQYEAQLRAAHADLTKAKNGATDEELDEAKAALRAAKARLARIEAGARAEELDRARADVRSAAALVDRATDHLRRSEEVNRRGTLSPEKLEIDRAAHRDAKAKHDAARAALRLLEAGGHPDEIAEAKAEVARLQAAFERLEVGTRSEDVLRVHARVAELEAKLVEIEAHLKEAVVVAPEAGVVEVVSVRKGDLVAGGHPVVRILRTEDLWVKIYVPETKLGNLKLGQAVKVTVDSHPDHEFDGKIVHIASRSEFTPRNVQSADERKHQVFGVKVRIDNTQGVFKSGMAAEVSVPLAN